MNFKRELKVSANSYVGNNYCGITLSSSLDDLDDHFRWPHRVDLNLDLLGITHLDHESRVQRTLLFTDVGKQKSCIFLWRGRN